MAQAKKKQATRTKKQTRSTKTTGARRGSQSQKARRTQCGNKERNQVYIITAMSLIAGILLCANAAMMIA